MNGPIRRLAIGLFTAMFAMLMALTWYQVIRADELKNDSRNARPVLSERGKERGLIVTSDGVVLAQSVADTNDPRSFVRMYPEGETFAPVVGFSSFLLGNSGLEDAYSAQLRSSRDLTISDLISVILGRDLRPQSIETTVNSELQKAAYAALDGRKGAVVALDPKTGAVLALVSSPSFNPESLLGEDATQVWDDLLSHPDEPARDRASRELYAPGSTFKTVVAAAALDTGEAGPETVFPDPVAFDLPNSSATISNFGGGVCNDGNSITLLRAFIVSCNTTFADLAIRVGAEDLGITADALGFNRDFRFPWSVPEAVFDTESLAEDPAALGQSGIGERNVRATPLHMAMIAAAIAANGDVSNPFLVSRIFDADGNTVESSQPGSLGQSMSSATAAILGQMMERVVTEGTGRAAAVPGVRVAGKTGTAQGSGEFPNPWFIGFAPVGDPTIALAVFLEGSPELGETATGGSVAAPIARQLFTVWLGLEQ